MSFVLSCTLSHRIAAVGLVASAQLIPFKWCPDRRPVPMIDFHGTSDPEAPYRGGSSWVAPGHKGFEDQLAFVASWAQRNRCAPKPRDSVIAADVTRRVYTNCANNADVQLYTVHGGGHTWPGGGHHPEWFVGRMSYSIDASSLMWSFFREHPLPGK
jgi:polyhydroxybutyrate depolymerase